MSLTKKSSIEIAEGVASGEFSAREVTEAFLGQSEKMSRLGALTFVARDEALAAADALDGARARGETLGKLAGVPLSIKDAICTEGLPTTAGSKILRKEGGEPWRAPYDATVIRRLKAEGAVILSKANMDEFAMGSSSETSAYGPVRNPWAEDRVPGGSSGGSAVAVAAELAAGALGSDTGGSIRQPAAHCGVVGVKPTYGRVSRYGLIAFASSLDQVGPFAKDVRSAARLLEVIAGDDPRDSTTSSAPVGSYEAACEKNLSGLSFGLPEEYFAEGLDSKIRERIDEIIVKLRGAGAEMRPIKLPHTHYGVATYYILATAEASSNLSRFDGVRYGLRREVSGGDLADLYKQTRSAGFGEEVKRRILLGTYVLSAGYYDAYYAKAQKVRTLIRRDFDAAFSEVDVILAPTSPTPAFKLGERTSDPLSMYLADVYTLPASLAGIAGVSVPAGTVGVGGSELPIGIQILAPALGEEVLFRAAAGVERLAVETLKPRLG